MIIAVNVAGDQVGGGLGRAQRLAVADVEDGAVAAWTEYDVGWDVAHDRIDTGEEAHGTHHGRIAGFMREHQVEVVVAGHVGPPMAHSLGLMGIAVLGAAGDARQAAVEAAAHVAHMRA